MATNNNLIRANKNKCDEFYTLYSTIEKEIPYYVDQLKGKTIYCNCDDPYQSNFFRYFIYNFNKLGLRRLICSCFAGNAIYGVQRDLFYNNNQLFTHCEAWCADISTVDDSLLLDDKEELDVKMLINLTGNTLTRLRTGDFRSDECVALLRQCDIVITNPPFSLARDFIDILVKWEKEYLFLSNHLLFFYSTVTNEYKKGRCRFGVSINGGSTLFRCKDRLIGLSGVCWITSLRSSVAKRKLPLRESYSNSRYQKYDNFNAIDVPSYKLIPKDYQGMMGVPITLLYFDYEDSLRIIGTNHYPHELGIDGRLKINGKETFKRIIVQHKQPAL